MPKCMIDGRSVEFQAGDNLVKAAGRVGIEIPVFCYHPGLSVVAQCRMCAIEIDKMPKLQTACSTPAAEGMVVHTTSLKVAQNRKSVMEFLLMNHPLDCPICDKSGECDLQEHSFAHGDVKSHFTEERRTYLDLDMGPVIKKNMNRCIHCTRCIRFGAEIAGIREMVAVKRGNQTEITTLEGRPLETDYAGNYADICPTGSLTLKEFRFKKRVWMLKKTPTLCEGCSRGCNLELHHEGETIYRATPRENLEVNRYWLCDEGRFHYRATQDAGRVLRPLVRQQSSSSDQGDDALAPSMAFAVVSWSQAISAAQSVLQGKQVVGLLGADLTQEEATQAQQFLQANYPGSTLWSFGTPGVVESWQDGGEDSFLRRVSKTPNLNGLEKLGIEGFAGLPAGTQAALVIRGSRAVLPALGSLPLVLIAAASQAEVEAAVAGSPAGPSVVVLPGLGFAEKSGTWLNFENREQKLQQAIPPRGQSRALPEILMLLSQSHGAASGNDPQRQALVSA